MQTEKPSERDIGLMDRALREARTSLAYGGAGVAELRGFARCQNIFVPTLYRTLKKRSEELKFQHSRKRRCCSETTTHRKYITTVVSFAAIVPFRSKS